MKNNKKTALSGSGGRNVNDRVRLIITRMTVKGSMSFAEFEKRYKRIQRSYEHSLKRHPNAEYVVEFRMKS